jgi:hypothetical protein
MGAGASSAPVEGADGGLSEKRMLFDEDGNPLEQEYDDDYGEFEERPEYDDGEGRGSGKQQRQMGSDAGGDSESGLDESAQNKKKGGMFSFFKKEELVDPPLPDMGPPTGYYVIMDRTKKAKKASMRIMELVDLEAVDNVMEGQRVCVHDDKERITVSRDQEDAIAQRKSKKEIRANVENNILEIQRNLFWKKTIVEMMNHNFHHVEVRPVPKVDHKQSRVANQMK